MLWDVKFGPSVPRLKKNWYSILAWVFKTTPTKTSHISLEYLALDGIFRSLGVWSSCFCWASLAMAQIQRFGKQTFPYSLVANITQQHFICNVCSIFVLFLDIELRLNFDFIYESLEGVSMSNKVPFLWVREIFPDRLFIGIWNVLIFLSTNNNMLMCILL